MTEYRIVNDGTDLLALTAILSGGQPRLGQGFILSAGSTGGLYDPLPEGVEVDNLLEWAEFARTVVAFCATGGADEVALVFWVPSSWWPKLICVVDDLISPIVTESGMGIANVAVCDGRTYMVKHPATEAEKVGPIEYDVTTHPWVVGA